MKRYEACNFTTLVLCGRLCNSFSKLCINVLHISRIFNGFRRTSCHLAYSTSVSTSNRNWPMCEIMRLSSRISADVSFVRGPGRLVRDMWVSKEARFVWPDVVPSLHSDSARLALKSWRDKIFFFSNMFSASLLYCSQQFVAMMFTKNIFIYARGRQWVVTRNRPRYELISST